MKKWLIGLSILCVVPTIDLEAQVYNKKFDKRFSEEIHSAEHYQNHIQKLQKRLYTDYHNFLTELNFSQAYNRIELMRQDRIERLEEIRYDLNHKIDYDQQFNDAKNEITKDFNILIDHYLSLYQREIKTNVQIFSNKLDSLPEYKEYLKTLTAQVNKATTSRSVFETNFDEFQENYNIAIENKEELEEYSPLERKLFVLSDKIDKIESLTLYVTKINKDLTLLETIDFDFREAVKNMDAVGMENTIKYQRNHSNEVYSRINNLGKYNDTENELKSNALRVAKNYQSNSTKIYASILKFSQDNKRVLIQERKNKEEYEAVIKDKGSFKNKADYKAYVANPPSQKFTQKYESLVVKYREKTANSLNEYNISLNELISKYINNYNPINENF